MCEYCEKKIRNLKNAKITPQTYIGKRFGNVVIIDCYWLYKSGRNRIYVDYRCACGTIKTSNIEHLLQGHIISCGCVKTKRTIARNKKHGLYNDNRRLFDVWNNMIQRCENSKNNSFENYGKRGIKVCKEWHDLKTFIDWAKSTGYEERDINNRSNVLSIERINVNGNYEPSNCKWIPVREQAWNKRNSKKMCRKEAAMNIDDYKPVNNVIRYTVVFYEEPSKRDTWGSNDVMYEIYYNSKDGIMQVHEIGTFGDSTLVAMYQDRRGRGITLKEMLENIEEISNMTYKEFKEKIVKRRLG